MRGCSGGRQEQMIPIFISIKDQPAIGAKDSADPICGLAEVMKAVGQTDLSHLWPLSPWQHT
jgi:hypothetical protein